MMTIRILEDGYLKKGIVRVSDALAKDLISKGMAVVVRENGLDKQAHDSLNDAKARDQQ